MLAPTNEDAHHHDSVLFGNTVFCQSPANLNRANNMTVMKFGGSSLATSSRVRHVCSIVRDVLKTRPCVIVSALGKTTSWLLTLANTAKTSWIPHRIIVNQNPPSPLPGVVSIKQLKDFHITMINELFDPQHSTITQQHWRQDTTKRVEQLLDEIHALLNGIALLGEVSNRVSDRLMSYGERLSAIIVAGYLNFIGLKAKSIDAWDAGMTTTKSYGTSETDRSCNRVLGVSYERLHDYFKPLNQTYNFTPVVTGFIAKDEAGEITTLGRSGSDYSAAIIGAAVHARSIEIWTDVEGVFTADPRHINGAKPIPVLSFEEASELAYFGANVLHPETMRPAMRMGVPIIVKSTLTPQHAGTTVQATRVMDPEESVTAITSRSESIIVDIHSTNMLGAPGFLKTLFSVFDDLNLSVDVIATSEVSVSITLDRINDNAKLQELKRRLNMIATSTIDEGKSIVSILCNTKKINEILHKACGGLAKQGITIQMLSYGASKVNVNFIVDEQHEIPAIQTLHDVFLQS